jgi:hypothetical protein
MIIVPRKAFVTDANIFQRYVETRGTIHGEILNYCHRLVLQVAQIGLCNSVHSVERRLCRWLLAMQDRTGSSTLMFTQDFIASVLGTRRATISVAAAALQSSDLSESIRSVKVGPNSGQAQVKLVAIPGAGSYELRWAPVPAGGVPSQWTIQPITNVRSAKVVTGLTPGTTYVFQARAVIQSAYTDWSDSVTQMAT